MLFSEFALDKHLDLVDCLWSSALRARRLRMESRRRHICSYRRSPPCSTGTFPKEFNSSLVTIRWADDLNMH